MTWSGRSGKAWASRCARGFLVVLTFLFVVRLVSLTVTVWSNPKTFAETGGEILAGIKILAGMLLPALSKAKLKAMAANCISNQKQLALGWCMYNDDNKDNVISFNTLASPNRSLVLRLP